MDKIVGVLWSYWSLLWCGLPLLGYLLFIWSLCKVSSMCERIAEQQERKWQERETTNRGKRYDV